MPVPTFDDFMSSVTREGIERWVDDANSAKLSIELPLKPENVNDFLTKSLTASLLTAQSMMRDYHEWLMKEILQIVHDQ